MILWVTGIGKSTLVNSLLKLKNPEATDFRIWDIQTMETTIYQSNKVPFLHQFDKEE